jgi:hypothetical protein
MRDDAVACALDDRIDEVARGIEASPYRFALTLSSNGIVLGRVRRSSLASTDSGARVEAVMEPGPSTMRPHLTVEELAQRFARSEVRTLIVTNPEGKLIGVVRVVAVGFAAAIAAGLFGVDDLRERGDWHRPRVRLRLSMREPRRSRARRSAPRSCVCITTSTFCRSATRGLTAALLSVTSASTRVSRPKSCEEDYLRH